MAKLDKTNLTKEQVREHFIKKREAKNLARLHKELQKKKLISR